MKDDELNNIKSKDAEEKILRLLNYEKNLQNKNR